MPLKVKKSSKVKKADKKEVKEEELSEEEEPKKEVKKEAKKEAKKEVKKEDKKEVKTEVKTEAKKEAPSKEGKKEATSLRDLSDEDKERITNEAIEEIKMGVKGNTKPGTLFVPDKWSEKYKRVLGAYKKFVETQKDVFTLVQFSNGGYVVAIAGEQDSVIQKPAPGSGWQKVLQNAWQIYCTATPKHERSVDVFVKALPQSVRNTKPQAADEEAAAKPTSEGTKGVKRKAEVKEEKDKEEEEKEEKADAGAGGKKKKAKKKAA